MNNAPVYTPICNSLLRFYFSDPLRGNFNSPLAERQFLTVKEILSSLSPKERERLQAVIFPLDGKRDISDSYIQRRLTALRYSHQEITNFYGMLYSVNKRIAVQLGYIADHTPSKVEWVANW